MWFTEYPQIPFEEEAWALIVNKAVENGFNQIVLDLGWADHGGQDVVTLIRQLEGRLSRIHLKDYADMPEDGSVTTPAYLRPIFEGKLPCSDYINALAKAGCEYMLVEQDYSYGEDEFEVLRRSYVNVTSRFPECK